MASYRDLKNGFDEYDFDPEEVLAEMGFAYFADNCDGFCPECKKMLKCVAYKDIGDEWDSFYT